MTPPIAVVCATQPGANPGMASVDFAFARLASQLGLDDRFRLYRLYPSEAPVPVIDGRPLSYETLTSVADLASASAIVYWGDFVHMRQYQRIAASHLVAHGLASDLPDAHKRVRELLLLSDASDDLLRRTLSFGTTLFLNSVQDELSADYGPHLERFVRQARGAWFRDVASALKACHLAGSYDRVRLGVDGAMVACSWASPPQLGTSAGIFLGRTSNVRYIELMAQFGVTLATRLGLHLEWITWGDVNAFPSLVHSFSLPTICCIDQFTRDAASNVHTALSGLSRHRLIISDTYHVCVNAWLLGIPAVCVAETEQSGIRNAKVPNYFSRRDKRQLFMSMYDALDFFVPTNELENTDYRERRVAHISGLLEAGTITSVIRDKMEAHSVAATTAFVSELRALI
jgi:hypothetical protein